MGVKERRERERLETRAKILDAAREMFVRDGVEAVTMRAIAERIEYTPTAIYHHFRDKQALITELCEHDFATLIQVLSQIGAIEDPVERLRRLGRAYVRFALEHPNQYRFMFMTPLPPVRPPQDHPNAAERSYALLRDCVAQAIAAGRLRPEYRDPEQVAQICWAMVHGIAALHVVCANQAEWIPWRDPEATAEAAIEALTRGLSRATG